MSTFRYPSVFLSHGTPMSAFGEDSYQEMLHQLAQSLPKPKAVLFISAHTVSSDKIHILKTKRNWNQHDYNGFTQELYDIQYECPGDETLATEVASLLNQAGLPTQFDTQGPLDHGIWIPLRHLYPAGDVPVVRLSLPLNMIPAQVLKIGHTLAKLREQGILLIASGGAVHNLKLLKWHEKKGEGAEWAHEFEQWLILMLKTKNVDALLTAEEHPLYLKAHPSQEHFLPLLFTVGAALPSDEVHILHFGIEYGSLSTLCFSLNIEQKLALH